jgi:hypothetical protein
LTPGDVAFEKDIKTLLDEYCSVQGCLFGGESLVDIHEQLANFPDASLLTLYANPLLVQYFADNI